MGSNTLLVFLSTEVVENQNKKLRNIKGVYLYLESTTGAVLFPTFQGLLYCEESVNDFFLHYSTLNLALLFFFLLSVKVCV